MDRLQSSHEAALGCYKQAIQALKQYSIDIDRGSTQEHKGNLEHILRQVESAGEPDELSATSSALRGELRAYRDRAAVYLLSLRDELTAATRALEEMMNATAAQGDNQEQRLRQELTQLKSLAQCDDVNRVRMGLQVAVDGIASCIEQIRRENQMAIAQFRDEIRTLQQRVERAESVSVVEQVTLSATRKKMAEATRTYIATGQPFCLGVFWLRNLRALHLKYGRQYCDELIIAFSKRLTSTIGAAAVLDRWADDEFVTALPFSKMRAMEISEHLSVKLSSTYVCMHKGRAQSMELHVRIGILDHRERESEDDLFNRADSLLKAMKGG